jgi:hypothetical protein
VDLSRVHVTRLDKGSARLEKDLVHHKGIALDGEIEEVDGLLMTRVDRAVVESLTLTGVEQGVVMADGALYRKAINLDQLNSMFRRLERWPGVRSAQLVVRLADGRAESPGESRVRYISWEQGLPMPTPQFEVYDDHGNLIGITDFLWDELGVMGEFDGRVKYGRLLKPGQDPGDVVFDEKAREDALREATQMPMVRFIWRQLDHHQDVAGRVRRLASPRRQLHVPR